MAEAKKHIGLRYVWGGTSLTNGADCSGFCLVNLNNCAVINIRNLAAFFPAALMDNLVVADIESHMVNPAAGTVKYQVARLCICQGNGLSNGGCCHSVGSSRHLLGADTAGTIKVIVDSSDMKESEGDSYGYLSSEFVDVGYNWKTAVKIDPIDASISSIRQKVVAEAKKHIGLGQYSKHCAGKYR